MFLAAAVVAQWNKFSWTLPHSFGVSLPHQRRALGVGVSCVKLLSRGCSPTACRPGREIGMSAFSFGDGVAALDIVEDRRLKQVRPCPWQHQSSTASLDPRLTDA